MKKKLKEMEEEAARLKESQVRSASNASQLQLHHVKCAFASQQQHVPASVRVDSRLMHA